MKTQHRDGQWGYGYSMHDIEQAIHRIWVDNNKLKYEKRIVIGFANLYNGEDTAYLLPRKYLQQNLPIVLVQANSEVHKTILKQEKELEIHIERLERDVAQEIYQHLLIDFTDEDGEKLDLVLNFDLTILPTENPKGRFATLA